MSQPPRKITDRVDDRDNRRCVRCGVSLHSVSGSRHHRMVREVGGHLIENLVLLCGSGTTRCHGWVHANPEAARREGLIIPTSVKVHHIVVVPLRMTWPDYDPFKPVYVQLAANGDRTVLPEGLALELLFNFGMLPAGVR